MRLTQRVRLREREVFTTGSGHGERVRLGEREAFTVLSDQVMERE